MNLLQFAPLVLVVVSAMAAACACLQVIDAPFIYDDNIYITNNTELKGLHLTELWRLFVEPYNSMSEFLPLRELSYWFDITLFGMNPSAFRMHNILLYLLCLPLVYATTLELWRYFRPADAASAPWTAATVTALFALHPAHVEAVVWISGRKDVLSALFSLLALWLAVRARREHGLSAPHAATTLFALLAAMLSKATAVAVAPVIALLWAMFWLDIPKPDRRRSLLLWPLASLLLAACIALIFATIITTRTPLYFGVEAATRSLAILGWLARLAVSPENRHFFYPVFEDPDLPVMVTTGVAVLAAAVAGGIAILHKRSLESFTLLTFFLVCMPSIQLIPYTLPSLVSDRFLFLAVWPVILLIIVLSWRLKPAPRTTLLLVIALAWSFQTVERPRDWRSFEAMVDTDLRVYPGYHMPAMHKIVVICLDQALYNDANETANRVADPVFRNILIEIIRADYAVRVKTITTGKPQEAMSLLWKLGIDLKQRPVQTKWDSTINYFWEKGILVLTLEWYSLSVHFPDDVSVRYNAGLSLLNVHKYEEAAVHLRAATESQHLPESVRGTAFYSLGLALKNSGQIAEVEAPLRAALEQSPPDLRAYCLLSKVYKQAGRLEEEARAEAICNGLTRNEKATP